MNVHEQCYSIRPVTYHKTNVKKGIYRHCTISITNAFKCIKNAITQHLNDSSSLFSTSHYTVLPLFMHHLYQQQGECNITNTSAISFQSAFVFNTDQKGEGTLDNQRRDGVTNFILRIKQQETHLTLHEHDDDDDGNIYFHCNSVVLL